MQLIDKYALLNEIETTPFEDYFDYEKAREVVELMPTVEAIVHCKNCRYRDLNPINIGIDKYLCRNRGGLCSEKDFCSWGKRK